MVEFLMINRPCGYQGSDHQVCCCDNFVSLALHFVCSTYCGVWHRPQNINNDMCSLPVFVSGAVREVESCFGVAAEPRRFAGNDGIPDVITPRPSPRPPTVKHHSGEGVLVGVPGSAGVSRWAPIMDRVSLR